jgi:hypothetical protein
MDIPDYHKYEVRKQIKTFYKAGGLSTSPNIRIMNDSVAEIFLKMLLEAQSCTKKLVLVPHMTLAKPTVIWLALNVKRSIIESSSNELSMSCIRRIVNLYRSPLELASVGL